MAVQPPALAADHQAILTKQDAIQLLIDAELQKPESLAHYNFPATALELEANRTEFIRCFTHLRVTKPVYSVRIFPYGETQSTLDRRETRIEAAITYLLLLLPTEIWNQCGWN